MFGVEKQKCKVEKEENNVKDEKKKKKKREIERAWKGESSKCKLKWVSLEITERKERQIQRSDWEREM